MSHVFSVIGLNHSHIQGQVKGLLDTGRWKLKDVYAAEEDLLQDFVKRFPDANVADSAEQILEDDDVELVASASINADRGPIAVQVLDADKHFFVDIEFWEKRSTKAWAPTSHTPVFINKNIGFEASKAFFSHL